MSNTKRKCRTAGRAWLPALAFAALVSGGVRAAERPHVLLIHADQVRSDALGAYGNTQIKTPALDRLAADGVLFKNSFCSFPVCTPSRYSLLSGLPVHEHRGWDNHCTLPPGTATFASLLRQAGYATKAVGKMHFAPTYLDVGFSEMELAEQDGPGRWDDDYHRYLRNLGLVDANDLEDQRSEYRARARRIYWENVGALPSNLDEARYSTTWIGDRAVETLEKWNRNSPALLMVGFIKPHHPFDPPEPWAHRYDPNTTPLLPGWVSQTPAQDLALSPGYFTNRVLTETNVRRATTFYYASLSEVDAQIGRIIQMLKARGLYDSSLIIFTSDHGEYLGFHHLLLKGNYPYDPLAKVPLIIKYPHGRGAGSVSERLVSNIDLAPTILKLIRNWFLAFECTERSAGENNYLQAINVLLEYARKQKYVPRDFAVMDDVDQSEEADFDIEIFTADEVTKILAAVKKDALPALAIGAFAGIRTAEVCRLDWSEVNLEKGLIEIKKGKAKTRSRRLVPITPNLALFLKGVEEAERSGPVWGQSEPFLFDLMRDAGNDSGVKWKHNALRHSFISYRVAKIKNVNEVAMEAMNSPDMIFKHYRELVTEKEADAWFGVTPEAVRAAKVLADGQREAERAAKVVELEKEMAE